MENTVGDDSSSKNPTILGNSSNNPIDPLSTVFFLQQRISKLEFENSQLHSKIAHLENTLMETSVGINHSFNVLLSASIGRSFGLPSSVRPIPIYMVPRGAPSSDPLSKKTRITVFTSSAITPEAPVKMPTTTLGNTEESIQPATVSLTSLNNVYGNMLTAMKG